jgi:sulfite reductase alpha subunit-like flavoprotein
MSGQIIHRGDQRIGIIAEQGGKGVEEASEYVEKLRSDKRYKRDVY